MIGVIIIVIIILIVIIIIVIITIIKCNNNNNKKKKKNMIIIIMNNINNNNNNNNNNLAAVGPSSPHQKGSWLGFWKPTHPIGFCIRNLAVKKATTFAFIRIHQFIRVNVWYD